jgi:tetratricopeptide (TPR) repeat protein
MDVLTHIWELIPGVDDAAKLRFVVVAAGGLGAVWGLVRWLRKEDLGTTAKSILKTQAGVVERANENADRLRHLEDLFAGLQSTLEARLGALPNAPAMQGMAVEGIASDLRAAIVRLGIQGHSAALSDLAAGNGSAAEAAFDSMRAAISRSREEAAKEEAALAREQGAIALLTDSGDAMRHYAAACKADPEEPSNWQRLGHLEMGAGNLAIAKEMYSKALALSLKDNSTEGMAFGYATLGKLAEMRQDMTEACGTWRSALMLFRQVGMTSQIEQVEGWMRDAGCPAE